MSLGLGARQHAAGQDKCEECLGGRYMDTEGSTNTSCLPCAAGKITGSAGSSQCDICASTMDFQAEVKSILPNSSPI